MAVHSEHGTHAILVSITGIRGLLRSGEVAMGDAFYAKDAIQHLLIAILAPDQHLLFFCEKDRTATSRRLAQEKPLR